ncbi:MAG: hypothetical protein HY292_11870 [Planctomycetes bacterium]|nr:hypothetical protein [Planctomycetota bacterium]
MVVDVDYRRSVRSFSMGPIGRALIDSFAKSATAPVRSLDAARTGRDLARRLQGNLSHIRAVPGLDPAFAIYAAAQNTVSTLCDVLTSMPEMAPFVRLIGAAEEKYMPQGPPTSPLTLSQFTAWALYDAAVGTELETIGTCVLDLGDAIGIHETFRSIIRLLQQSRLGLFVHEGLDDSRVNLRELVSERQCFCVVPAGYRGVTGQLWLTRVLPPPAPAFSQYVVYGTPYVVTRPGFEEWKNYFNRSVSKLAIPDEHLAYEHLMKFGLSADHWNEYIFEAYLSHVPKAIFLAGLPDVAESRPHSRVNARHD